MKKISIYLDTSIINFLFAEDAPDLREVTIDFFENFVREKIYDVFISGLVIQEINQTQDEDHRARLRKVIEDYELEILDTSGKDEEIKALAKRYLDQGIIPAKKVEDALHIAITTVFEIEILLSWNYKHLANLNKERSISVVNIAEGYSRILRMTNPMEVIYEKQ